MFQKLKEENQKLWKKNMSLEKEIEDFMGDEGTVLSSYSEDIGTEILSRQ